MTYNRDFLENCMEYFFMLQKQHFKDINFDTEFNFIIMNLPGPELDSTYEEKSDLKWKWIHR